MELKNEERNLLIKIYIGQRIREEGIVDASLSSQEQLNLSSLMEKKLIENSNWKPFRNYSLIKTTEEGDKIASISIQKILYESNLGEEIQKIPLIFLKLCLFMDELFYEHPLDLEFEDFYWQAGKKEFLIEKGLKYWNRLIEIFKSKKLCVLSYYYVSTRSGELRDKYNILPEAEIKEFIKKKFGIIEGLSEDIMKTLEVTRQKIIKKRESIIFEEIIEDYTPKFAKVLKQEEKEILPIHEERGILIFLSYSTKDENKYGIKRIAERLTAYKNIENAIYWEEDMEDNIYEYMDENIGKCDIFILFCSPEALKSEPIKKEWTAADSLDKPIIPVFIKKEHIPPLLSSRRGIEYDIFNMPNFISELYDLVLKKVSK